MTLVILSPHRDDAAFSCGITMRLSCERGVPVRIVNIFTRSAYAPFLNTVDLDAISHARLQEDRALAAKLGSHTTLEDLAWADAPVRRGIPSEQTFDQPLDTELFQAETAKLALDLQPRIADATCLLLPLANQHLDHKIARAAGELCLPPGRLAWYEDLPYFARLSRGDHAAALRTLVPSFASRMLLVHPAGSAVKRDLAACYPSQIDPATVEEMARYSYGEAQQPGATLAASNADVGAEVLYAGDEAAAVLTRVIVGIERR